MKTEIRPEIQREFQFAFIKAQIESDKIAMEEEARSMRLQFLLALLVFSSMIFGEAVRIFAR